MLGPLVSAIESAFLYVPFAAAAANTVAEVAPLPPFPILELVAVPPQRNGADENASSNDMCERPCIMLVLGVCLFSSATRSTAPGNEWV